MFANQRDETGPQGLRELKKTRTRDTIIRVGLDLFGQRGFRGTTLVDIAGAAEIAPSTLYAYFPSKGDILFDHLTNVVASARSRFLSRPEGVSTVDALEQWLSDDLPELAETDRWAFRRRRAIIDQSEELLAEERQRLAALEEVFAAAFADDLDETHDELRSRLMAAMTVVGLRTVWLWSYRQQTEAGFNPRTPYALDRTYLTTILIAAEAAIEQLPGPS
jgi:AcrR family transcriptional regulator